MLQIRLNKGPSSDGGSGVKSMPAETVTVACPDHLVLADLPVAKGLGSATSAARVKTVGRRSRRQLGERVHFCVRCDYPIAIYGRLTPCEHVFCLDCARSDSMCYLCDDRIQKIQTIKLMEGIFICAAPHCLKSFLKKTDFELHIHGSHSELLQPNTKKEEGNESAAESSGVRAPQKPTLPPLNEDRGRSQTPLRPLETSASSEKVYYQQPPNFAVPIIKPSPNQPSPFGFPPFPPSSSDGYGSHMNLEVADAPPGFSEPHAHSWGSTPPPPPGPPTHLLQQNHDNSSYSADRWSHHNRDGFGTS